MKVQICIGKSCSAKFSSYISKRLANDIKFHEWRNLVIEESCCMGACKKAPNMRINSEIVHYCQPSKASEIVHKKIAGSIIQSSENSKN